MSENQLLNDLVCHLEGDVEDLSNKLENTKREKDILVAILAKEFPSVLAPHTSDESGWDRGWGWVCYLKLPTGQVSWHIDDTSKAWFSHLSISNVPVWDGHDSTEKMKRIVAFLERKEAS